MNTKRIEILNSGEGTGELRYLQAVALEFGWTEFMEDEAIRLIDGGAIADLDLVRADTPRSVFRAMSQAEIARIDAALASKRGMLSLMETVAEHLPTEVELLVAEICA